MTALNNRPAKVSSVLALLLGASAVRVSAAASTVPMVVTVVGFGALALGLLQGSRGWLAEGTMAMIVGTTFAGIAGLSATLVVVGAAATVASWDFSERAISLGEQLGRGATTRRNEAVHAGMTVLVGIGAVGGAQLISGIRVQPLPLPALVAGLLAVLILIGVLRS